MKTPLLVLALSFSACGAAQPSSSQTAVASPNVGSTRGTIKEIRKNGAVLVIAHEDIPGMMKAMTMPFQVEEKARRADLKVSDKVAFTVEERDGVYVIIKLERI